MNDPAKYGSTVICAWAAICAILGLATQAHAQICFDHTVLNTTEDNVRAVAIADITGNGSLDIVTGRQNGTIALFANDGLNPPSFSRTVLNTQSGQIRSLVIEDLNNDGLMDLVSASSTDNTIAWYRQNPGGGFTRIILTNQALDARSVAVADLNGNNLPDIVSASFQDNRIRVFRNDPASGTHFQEQWSATVNQASSVHIADIDGDGLADIVATSRSDRDTLWFKNLGGPTLNFAPPVVIPNSNQRVDSAVAADINGDGLIDIITASSNDNDISWYRNMGGSPSLFSEFTVSTAVSFPTAIVAVDLDGDGHMDIVTTSLVGNEVVWLHNNGDQPPTFTKRTVLADLDGAINLAVGDLTGNGAPDIASVATRDSAVTAHLQPRVLNQTNGVSYPLISRALLAAQPGDVLLADQKLFEDSCESTLNFFGRAVELRSTGPINRSALTSTVLANGSILESATGTEITVLGTLTLPPGAYASIIGEDVTIAGPVSIGAGSTLDTGPRVVLAGLPNFTERLVTGLSRGVWSVRAGDLDGDGNMDLVSADESDNRISWYRSSGGLNPIFTRNAIPITVQAPRSVHLADLNGNGHLDILIAASGNGTVSWFENSGTNPPQLTQRVITTQAAGARSVFAADLTGNGVLDVISASSDNNTVAWYESSGGPNPTFSSPRIVSNQAMGAAAVHAADINGDGRIDIIAAIQLSNEVAWFENNGDSPPTFTKRTVSNSQNGVQYVLAADLNNDGTTDIISASSATSANKISWFANNGGQNPTFTQYTVDASITTPVSLAVGDLDQDGHFDIAATSAVGNQTFWYRNDGASTPTFTRTLISDDRARPRTVEIADMDGDGDLDIIVGSSSDNQINWYQSSLITDIALNQVDSGIVAPGDMLLNNKSVMIGQSTRLASGQILGIDASSAVSGRGRLEAPLVSLGGVLRPDPGHSITVQGNYLNSYLSPSTGRQSGSFKIHIPSNASPTRLEVTQVAGLGGGLEVTVASGITPIADQPFMTVLTAATLDPQAPRFDVAFSPLLLVEGPDGPTQGTLVARYSNAGEPGNVSLVPITLEDLLFTTNTFDSVGTPNDAVIADITGGPNGEPDGILDLVIAIPRIEGIAPNGAVALLIGSNQNGSFGFGSVILYTGPEVDAPIAVEVGAFRQQAVQSILNEDLRYEIAFANRGDQSGNNNIHFLNVNSASAMVLIPSNLNSLPIPDGMWVTDMAVGDILQTGFQQPDLIYGVRGGGGAVLLLSTLLGAGAIWETCEVDVDDIDALVPFDRSFASIFGQNGLAATNPSNNTVRVFNIEFGDVDNATFVDIPTGTRPRQVLAAKLDDDQFTDLVVLCEGNSGDDPGVISLIRGQSNGFAGSVNLAITANPGVAPRPTSIALADLDNDGDLDIAIASANESGERVVRQLRNTSADSGLTGLSFTAATDIPDQPSGEPLIVLSADLDGSNGGVPDDLVILVDPNSRSRSSGTGGNSINLSVAPKKCLADFNGDNTVNIFDLFDFLTAYTAQDPAADLAPQFGEWNIFDLLIYLDLYNQGCP